LVSSILERGGGRGFWTGAEVVELKEDVGRR